MSSWGRFVVLVAVAAAVVGCGKTVVDDAKAEDAIKQRIEESGAKKVAAVECPSGVEVKVDESFECTLTLAGGKEETATMKIVNEDADIELTSLNPVKGGK